MFSLHEYYHQAGRHADEMDAIWAQKTPGLAMEEAVLNGRYVGLEAVRGYYVDFFERFFQQGLEEMRKIYPEVETEPGSSMPFGVQLLHTLTTPIIEVAEDRETAKAVWLSPGYVTAPAGGRLQAFWHWDRYAVISRAKRASGRSGTSGWGPISAPRTRRAGWRRLSTPRASSWIACLGVPSPTHPATLSMGGTALPAGGFVPLPPLPYRTFSETFSY